MTYLNVEIDHVNVYHIVTHSINYSLKIYFIIYIYVYGTNRQHFF